MTFTAVDEGTLVSIVHSGLSEPDAEQHGVGWTHYLARLAMAGARGHAGPDPFATRAGS